MRELLTEHEHEVAELLGKCYVIFNQKICGRGPTRDHDLTEFASRIHDLQNAVLAQAAARAYPNTYRLAGDSLKGRS